MKKKIASIRQWCRKKRIRDKVSVQLSISIWIAGKIRFIDLDIEVARNPFKIYHLSFATPQIANAASIFG